MSIDRQAAARAISAFLQALGHEPERNPELRATPERVADAFADDLLGGYAVDVPALLASAAPENAPVASGIVVVRDISVATVCPHHLMPGLGSATVAYLPGARVLGIGTIAALVDAFARRLALQEEIGENVTRALVDHAGARGAYCELTLAHSCLSARGQRETQATVQTVSSAGALATGEGIALLGLALGQRDRS